MTCNKMVTGLVQYTPKVLQPSGIRVRLSDSVIFHRAKVFQSKDEEGSRYFVTPLLGCCLDVQLLSHLAEPVCPAFTVSYIEIT